MVRGAHMLALAALPVLVAASVSSTGLMDALQDLPSCGLQCFTSTIGESSCGLLDADCLCSDENFLAVAEDCILAQCSTVEALEVSRTVFDGCGRPRRNRKSILLIPLIVEIPAAFCPWLRLYANWMLQKRVALDDWLMTATGLFYLVFLGIGIFVGQHAFGEDIWYVDPDRVTTGLKYFYIDETFYLTCLCLTKVSVLCFYLRIFTTQKFRWAAYTTMGLVVLPLFVLLFLQIFQCHPIHLIWDGWLTKGWEDNCLNLNHLAYVAASVSIGQDALLIALPMPWLVRLNISLKTKLGVIPMFSLGVFVLATSCTRLSYILAFGHTSNPTWDYVDPIIWTGLEVAVSIIVACLPALRLLLLHYVPSLMSSVGLSSTKATGRNAGYGKFDRSGSRSTGSKLHKSGDGTMMSSNENESQIELGANPFDSTFEENGYRSKTPTEVKVAAAENTYELTTKLVPSRGILVQNELVVESESTSGEALVGDSRGPRE